MLPACHNQDRALINEKVLLVGHVANVLRLDDNSIYFFNDDTGPVIQIQCLYCGQTGFIRRAGDMKYVKATSVTIV